MFEQEPRPKQSRNERQNSAKKPSLLASLALIGSTLIAPEALADKSKTDDIGRTRANEEVSGVYDENQGEGGPVNNLESPDAEPEESAELEEEEESTTEEVGDQEQPAEEIQEESLSPKELSPEDVFDLRVKEMIREELPPMFETRDIYEMVERSVDNHFFESLPASSDLGSFTQEQAKVFEKVLEHRINFRFNILRDNRAKLLDSFRDILTNTIARDDFSKERIELAIESLGRLRGTASAETTFGYQIISYIERLTFLNPNFDDSLKVKLTDIVENRLVKGRDERQNFRDELVSLLDNLEVEEEVQIFIEQEEKELGPNAFDDLANEFDPEKYLESYRQGPIGIISRDTRTQEGFEQSLLSISDPEKSRILFPQLDDFLEEHEGNPNVRKSTFTYRILEELETIGDAYDAEDEKQPKRDRYQGASLISARIFERLVLNHKIVKATPEMLATSQKGIAARNQAIVDEANRRLEMGIEENGVQ